MVKRGAVNAVIQSSGSRQFAQCLFRQRTQLYLLDLRLHIGIKRDTTYFATDQEILSWHEEQARGITPSSTLEFGQLQSPQLIGRPDRQLKLDFDHVQK